jgi:hypothetical protein
MTLMDRERIAKDTMAFWFDTHGAPYEFQAGQHSAVGGPMVVTLLYALIAGLFAAGIKDTLSPKPPEQ